MFIFSQFAASCPAGHFGTTFPDELFAYRKPMVGFCVLTSLCVFKASIIGIKRARRRSYFSAFSPFVKFFVKALSRLIEVKLLTDVVQG